jgi:hypothetical protein
VVFWLLRYESWVPQLVFLIHSLNCPPLAVILWGCWGRGDLYTAMPPLALVFVHVGLVCRFVSHLFMYTLGYHSRTSRKCLDLLYMGHVA